MEVLSRILHKKETANALHGIQIARGAPPISHLLFVDDIMLFCRANGVEVTKLNNCLLKFSCWFGQMINTQNSFIHFSGNMCQQEKDHLASIMQLNRDSNGSNHLGLPLCMPRSRSQACRDLIDRVNKRITGWKTKTLSQAGRTVLLQTVAAALPTYFMAVYSLPKEVARNINFRFKNFGWGFDDPQTRHFHPKAWQEICAPKSRGGISLRTMEDMNWALITKCGWNLIIHRDMLWVKALKAKYCRNSSYLSALNPFECLLGVAKLTAS